MDFIQEVQNISELGIQNNTAKIKKQILEAAMEGKMRIILDCTDTNLKSAEALKELGFTVTKNFYIHISWGGE